jgi:hypothetical protein
MGSHCWCCQLSSALDSVHTESELEWQLCSTFEAPSFECYLFQSVYESTLWCFPSPSGYLSTASVVGDTKVSFRNYSLVLLKICWSICFLLPVGSWPTLRPVTHDATMVENIFSRYQIRHQSWISLKMELEEADAFIFLFSRLRKRRKNGDFGYTQS